METINQRRTLRWVVTILTFSLIIITVTTYVLDLHKNNWVCGPILLIFELIALGFLSILTIKIWKTESPKIMKVITVISLGLMTFITWNFVSFLTNCS
jgi:hypothetical protein